jgi:hypothetical protein
MPTKDDLRNLIQAGAKDPGKPQYRRLAKGLTIALKVDRDVVRLQLSRDKVYPSPGEWKTVLNCWPEQYDLIGEPKSVQQGEKFFILGRLRRTPDLIGTGSNVK